MSPHQVPFPTGYYYTYGPAYPLDPPPGGGWQPQPPPPRHPGYRISPAPLPCSPAISPPFDVYGHARLDYYAPPRRSEPPEAQHIDMNEAGPSRASRGRDYLSGLGSAMDGLQVGEPSPRIRVVSSSTVGSSSSPNRDKPLPNLPRHPLPPIANASHSRLSLSASQSRPDHRSSSLPSHAGLAEAPSASSQHDVDVYRRPHVQTHKSSPPRMFRPSSLLSPPSPPTIPRPHSDPVLSHQTTAQTPTHHGKPTRGKHRPATSVIDLTTESDSDPSSPTSPGVTPRSAARRRRATSEQPPSHLTLSASHSSPSKSPSPASPGKAVRCAGFTRTGQPCKRLVRASAPYLAALEPNTLPASFELGEEADPVGLGRYCKDHAGMICQPTGFYSKERRGLWLDFDDWISAELEQQTQALLRMVMESKLTAKESPGFLYAYELRGGSYFEDHLRPPNAYHMLL
ncbi:hypothetical protein EHS25_008259 [Saitozyma podzolica]|uniref:Uncharacterized protein n=1 Tax=Saitozyma podzolica TaxID=1890683 RepID=A0A427YP02_9TREE|nr:hypothetical protein EHS25_008259 [Saitozyma podzolica]